MSAVFNGYADIRHIGTDCTVQIEGYAQVMMDTLPVVHRATVSEHVGVNGKTCAIVHTNQYLELAISFRPVSDVSQKTIDDAFLFIPKGAGVTLSGFKPLMVTFGTPPVAVDVLQGDWLLVGDVTLTRNSNDPGTVDMTLRHYLDGQVDILKTIPAVPPPP